MAYPLVSIIIPTHNRARFLVRAVESIYQQSYTNWELVIVNDASQDETRQVLTTWEADERVKIVNLTENVGPGVARNLGVQHAEGALIAILDDDDIARCERLAVQVELLQERPDVGLTFAPVQWVSFDGAPLRLFPGMAVDNRFPQAPDAIFTLLYLESNKIPNTTLMIRRDVWLTSGGYPAQPWIGEDWYWMMQLAASGIKMAYVDRPLVDFVRDTQHRSLMSNKEKAFICQKQILNMIRQWLKDQHINRFDELHARAMSNQLAREARFWGNWRGIGLCLRALWLWPGNPLAQRSLVELIQRGKRKIYRS